MKNSILMLINLGFRFITQNPFSFLCALVAIKEQSILFFTIWAVWSINLWFLKHYGLYKTSVINLTDLINKYIKNKDKYSFVEYTDKIFKNHRDILNSNTPIKQALSLLPKNKMQNKFIKNHQNVNTSIRVFIAKEKEMQLAKLKSFPVRADVSYIFLDRVYDEKNLRDKFKLLHEIGHCQVLTGQSEFESITHREYAIFTILMIMMYMVFSSVIVAIIFIYLSANMYIKYERRHKLSVIGYAEFMANSFALRFFYNHDKFNFESAINYIIEKYKNEIERSEKSSDTRILQFNLKLLKWIYHDNLYFGKYFLANSANFIAGYKKPLNPILQFNIFIFIIVYLGLYNNWGWFMIIPVSLYMALNYFRYFSQIEMSSKLSAVVQNQVDSF